MSRKKPADAIREEKQPQICCKHPSAVWFDEKKCPACKAIEEWMKLTNRQEKE